MPTSCDGSEKTDARRDLPSLDARSRHGCCGPPRPSGPPCHRRRRGCRRSPRRRSPSTPAAVVLVGAWTQCGSVARAGRTSPSTQRRHRRYRSWQRHGTGWRRSGASLIQASTSDCTQPWGLWPCVGCRSVANCDGFLSFGRSNHHKIMMMTGSKAAGVIGGSFGYLRMPQAHGCTGCSRLYSTRRRSCPSSRMLLD